MTKGNESDPRFIPGEVAYIPPELLAHPELIASRSEFGQETVRPIWYEPLMLAKTGLKAGLDKLNEYPRWGGVAVGGVGLSLGAGTAAIVFRPR